MTTKARKQKLSAKVERIKFKHHRPMIEKKPNIMQLDEDCVIIEPNIEIIEVVEDDKQQIQNKACQILYTNKKAKTRLHQPAQKTSNTATQSSSSAPTASKPSSSAPTASKSSSSTSTASKRSKKRGKVNLRRRRSLRLMAKCET